MKFKKIAAGFFFIASILFLSACGSGGVQKDKEQIDVEELTKNQPETHGTEIKESEITISNPLNSEWVSTGQHIYELKCQACHKLSDEKLVGPGWKDVTKRRQPVWIMNMITNVDMMLDTDPEAQKLLEQCMVRMPNQNIMVDDARKILEFMRSNDGEK